MLNPTAIKAFLTAYTNGNCCYLAYSGGLDSHVLLHLLVTANLPITAIHINHGLSPNAQHWEQHCAAICKNLQVSYQSIVVVVRPAQGESLEACARTVRYAEFAKIMGKNDCLLTAHQQDDQAETILLQMLRGAGPKGLAAMPQQAVFAAGSLLRALLAYSRAELVQYARAQQLQWIDDESNFTNDLARNYLRHEIIPILAKRWPGVNKTFARAAMHCAQAAELIDELAEQDYQTVRQLSSNRFLSVQPIALSIVQLKKLSDARQSNVLRYWFGQLALPMPTSSQGQQIQMQMLSSNNAATPTVLCQGIAIRRFQGLIYALPKLTPNVTKPIVWQPGATIPLAATHSALTTRVVTASGIGQHFIAQAKKIEIGFRQGGERIQPAGRVGAHPLKKLFQEWQVPPWLRAGIPLVYINDKIACVVGCCVCAEFAAANGEQGLEFYLITSEKFQTRYRQLAR